MAEFLIQGIDTQQQTALVRGRYHARAEFCCAMISDVLLRVQLLDGVEGCKGGELGAVAKRDAPS